MRGMLYGRIGFLAVLALTLGRPTQLIASCAAPANPIEAENCLPGAPAEPMGYLRCRER